MPNEQKATIDFETRSACDIKAHGTWCYSIHPSTEVLCLVYRLPTWDSGRTALWHPALPTLGLAEHIEADSLAEFFSRIDDEGLVEAHGQWFEYCIWTNILVARYGWPSIPLTAWRCSAAKAAAHSLHRDLDKATRALRLTTRKDMEGSKVMKKMAKPRKSRKAERVAALKSGIALPAIQYHESIELHDRLIQYCRQDVLTEEALSHALPDLSDQETDMFLMDLRMNATGFQLDRDAVTIALKLIHREGILLNQELTLLTDRQIKKATQRPKLLAWLNAQRLCISDTQKGTVDAFLDGTPDMCGDVYDLNQHDPKVRRVLEIMRALGRSSTAKYMAMRDWAGKDWRIRGGLLYHGASTGRWPLTGDHEALTPTGWVRLDEWAGGPIACWSPIGVVTFETATRLQFPVGPNERLVHWTNSKVDQLSTTDHAMPVFSRTRRSPVSSRVWGGGFVRKSIDAVSPGDRIPLCGLFTATQSWPFTDDQTRVLLMTQADGHYVRATALGRCLRFRFTKARKIQRCRELLSRAGVPFRDRVDAYDGVTVFTIPYEHMPEWLWSFNKRFSWDWLHAPAALVFAELVLWDGSKSSPEGIDYLTTVQQNADFVQALAHLSGRTCSITCRVRTGWSDAYRCFIDNAPAPVTFRKPQRVTVRTEHNAVYCAHTPTGYFLIRRNGRVWVTGNSGKGVQPHNFPKGSKDSLGCDIDVDDLWDVLKTGLRDDIAGLYNSVMEALANGLRGTIVASKGQTLFVADYASIEARVLLWAAGDEDALQVFRDGRDIYCEMAARIYGRPITKKDKDERQLGKAAVLGCGYQMGGPKFVATAATYGITIDEDFSKDVVAAYRAKFWRVKNMWYEQEEAAINAVESRKSVRCGKVRWLVQGKFLYCELPSGRRLAYCDPQVKLQQTSWGEMKPQLTFNAVNPKTHQWVRQSTYGGMIVENIVQAISRDIMAEAMLRAQDTSDYRVLLSVHDELVAECPVGTGDVEEFVALMTVLPQWAQGCPIGAEGWQGTRYRK